MLLCMIPRYVLRFQHIITTNDAKIVKYSLPNNKFTLILRIDKRKVVMLLNPGGGIRYTLILALKVHDFSAKGNFVYVGILRCIKNSYLFVDVCSTESKQIDCFGAKMGLGSL